MKKDQVFCKGRERKGGGGDKVLSPSFAKG